MSKIVKNHILHILITIIPFWSFGQKNEFWESLDKEIKTYKRMGRHADSLKTVAKVGQLNVTINHTTDSLDKLSPQAFFIKAGDLMDAGNYNEASFLFYLGNLRYGYCNLTNPNYSKSNEGALMGSFNEVLGQPLLYYLKANPDNYIEILKKSLNWYLTNDYVFWTKKKDPKVYADQSDKLRGLIADLEKNKSTYQKTWDNEREDLNRNFESALEQMKKK